MEVHLIVGGNQQGGLRSGTENTVGIYSIKLALEDSLQVLMLKVSLNSRKELEKTLNCWWSHQKYGYRESH